MSIRTAMVTVAAALFAAGLIYQAQGEQFEYHSKGRRDPFLPLVGADKVTSNGLEDVVSIEDIKLEGITTETKGSVQTRTVILNGEIMQEGGKAGIVEIKEIFKRSVRILIGGKEYSLSLSEEGGSKSEK